MMDYDQYTIFLLQRLFELQSQLLTDARNSEPAGNTGASRNAEASGSAEATGNSETMGNPETARKPGDAKIGMEMEEYQRILAEEELLMAMFLCSEAAMDNGAIDDD